ncbi:Hint domain-containing protein [Mameliella sp.]|uniref:Hint domain-containing protein n=1 Tax=Mameliella sp. TaxID=1924940 RepID=UPI003B50280C
MAEFEFDFGATGAATGATATLSLTDEGVNFTLSTSGNGADTSIIQFPNLGADGYISLTGNNLAQPFTLDVTAGNPSGSFFAGNGLQLEIGTFVLGNWDVTFVASNAADNAQFTNVTTGQVIDLGSTSTVFNEIRFTPNSAGGILTIDRLDATLLCFLEGTKIATTEGEKAVEELQAGDVLRTADGGTTTVEWLGRQPIDTTLSNPAKTNPIRIRAGALADNVPARDLLVSPDHAIGIDGYLVNASALINGTTVTREARMPSEGFTYFHVETGTHELLLAEGCAAESYVDFIGREGFANGAERLAAPAIPEMAAPRISATRHLPPAIRETLAQRAEALGLTVRAA